MVKLGFIVEGGTEKILLQSDGFQEYLRKLELDFIEDVIDVDGLGNLLPKFLEPITDILMDKGATHIFILTDLDEDKCITKTKELQLTTSASSSSTKIHSKPANIIETPPTIKV